MLMNRDLPHLPENSRRQIRSRLRQVSAQVAERISTAPLRSGPAAPLPRLEPHSAGLLAQGVLAVLQSPAFYHPRQTRSELCGELAELVRRVAIAGVPAEFSGAAAEPRGPGLMPVSRRDALLARAVDLFAERTYAGVRVEDVGASLDIAGPSIYKHFASKSEILSTALERGAACLSMQAADVLATTSSPARALRALVRGYCDFTLAHPALIALMISETTALPEPSKDLVVDSARRYVGELAHLLRQVRPELSQAAANVHVQAVLMIPNNVTRLPEFRTLQGIVAAVANLCMECLDPPESTPKAF
jgi:AcrR family transcriptional regulator